MCTTGMTSLWHHLVILIVFGGFARPARSESVVPLSTTMSHKSYSLPLSYSVTSSSQPPSAGDSGPNNRLDFISVAVICGVVAFCFIICLIVGCRRRKPRHHLPRCEDMTPTVISPSLTETDGPTLRATSGGTSSPSALRRYTESPPPTYSVIERQTSFSSYVSQTSSMIEVPPDYEEAWNPDISTTETEASQDSRRARHRPVRSNTARPNTKGPPSARSAYRSHSDIDGRRKRTRPSSRPSPVSENEVLSEFDSAARSIDVIIEANPSPRSSTALEQSADESSQPLIVNLDQRSTATSSQV